ncbi:MAG: sugar phosphate isomerase/epimerase [Ruminococcus sp.]|nr:sugar phosphate isomerase/epimerase [Ruminococcus sp.]
MRLSVFYDHILQAKKQSGKDLMTLVSGVKKAGVEAVEIRLSYLLEHGETMDLLRKAGLAVSCIYEFYEMDSRDEKVLLAKHIETAARLQAGRTLVVPGFFNKTEADGLRDCLTDYEQVGTYLEQNPKALRMAAGLREAAALGEKEDVIVTVEDFDDVRSPLFCINGIRWFMENVPGLRYTFDMGNFIYSGENAAEALALLNEKVAHVHCKDRGEHFSSVAAGDGSIPIAGLIERLKEYGYDDYLAIEHFDAPDQEETIRRSAEFLRKQF